MTREITKTSLEWARDFARSYRWALRKADPQRCDELDHEAANARQHWVAPTYVPTEAAEELLDSVLSAKEIAQALAVPVGTIYGWVSKGLLKPSTVDAEGEPLKAGGPAKYKVRDVSAVDGRRRVRRVDTA